MTDRIESANTLPGLPETCAFCIRPSGDGPDYLAAIPMSERNCAPSKLIFATAS